MELAAIGVVITLFAAIVWLNVLATIAIRCDATLERTQRIGQLLIVWLVPLIGAPLILRFVNEQSPDAIPKTWIPWPFKKLVYGGDIERNRDRQGENAEVNYSAGIQSRFRPDIDE